MIYFQKKSRTLKCIVTKVFKRGKYLISDRIGWLILKLIDLYSCLKFVKKKSFSFENGQKILICNIAHLGDALLSTSAVRYLAEQYPQMEIGFLSSSGSKLLLENHVAIKHIHVFDHWKLNRSQVSLAKKLFVHRKTYRRALSEIKKIGYDCAVDLYPFFPNSIPLIHRGAIPHRIGYTSGGFGPLLTQTFDFHWEKKSMAEYFLDLMRPFSKKKSASTNYFISTNSLRPFFDQKKYLIFHVGTPNEKKRWPQKEWIKLAENVQTLGVEIVFTGRGSEDCKLIEGILKSAKGINCCDKLNFEDLKRVIFSSLGVVSVDTMTAHLASALQKPTVVLHTGMHEVSHWSSLSSNSQVMTKILPCSPCMNSQGCSTMDCIKGIDHQEVFEKIKGWLK